MSPRNVFGIAVRLFALLLFAFAFWRLFDALAFTLSDSSMDRRYYSQNPYFALLAGIPAFVVAVCLLRYARQIVRFSYPKNKDDDDS